LKVLHVIPAIAPRYGGPSTAIWAMTGALRDLGEFDVEIATTDADGPEGRLAAADLPRGTVTVHLFRRERGENLKYSRELGRWLGAHAGDYDVIQSHSNWNFPSAVACRAARCAGVPYIVRPCGMLSRYTWEKSIWRKRAYWWLCERNNVRSAAGFHVTSDDERQEVLRLNVTAPVEVIPLGVSNDAWNTPIEAEWLRSQCPQAGNRPILLFLSRLHPKKGITDLLLPALAGLKTDAFLAVVGEEDVHAPGYTRHIEAEIGRRRLTERVALLGPVSPDRRWAALDGADLFVLPSHSENFGIVVAEALARAKPVVVTTGVQFCRHIIDAGAGTVVRPDVEELAGALDSWLSDPQRRAKAGESGKSYVREHLTWTQAAERLGDFYRRVCHRDIVATSSGSRFSKTGSPTCN
jgi:glycosyltransferase involved in cell wall biosynthesis